MKSLNGRARKFGDGVLQHQHPLRAKAAQCRRLAATTTDAATARMLRDLATEYEARSLIEESDPDRGARDAQGPGAGEQAQRQRSRADRF